MGILKRLQEPPVGQDVHPIMEPVLDAYFADDSFGLSEGALRVFERSLQELCLHRKTELPSVMMSALKFCMFVERELDDSGGCDALLGTLAVALPFVKLNNEPILDELRDLQARKRQRGYRELTATQANARAPEFGKAQPAQSVSLYQLRPRRTFK